MITFTELYVKIMAQNRRFFMQANKLIDHTLLKAESTKEQIIKLCNEALMYDFASVCVNSCWVSLCSELLKDSTVKVCTVVGFPLGASLTAVKVKETQIAIEHGASEIDMVMNIGQFKSGMYEEVENDIAEVVKAADGKIVKVILETCLLSKDEIEKACQLCVSAKAHFVKTSTGFNASGATPEVVEIMKKTVGDLALVKAAGGVRSFSDLELMVEKGASRIGTSSGVALMSQKPISGNNY